MQFSQKELCDKDKILLNEIRAAFQESYEKGVELWNKAQMLRSTKEKNLQCAYIQGNYEGLKYCADMLLHVLGQKKHLPPPTLQDVKLPKAIVDEHGDAITLSE